MSTREHWDHVYRTKRADDVSWFQPHLQRSLDLILHAGVGLDANIVDVGGGASTLVDDLLVRGFSRVTVVDISEASLDVARTRLGEDAQRVQWRVGDITTMEFLPASIDVWHDRAMFHFLTRDADRESYLRVLRHAVKPRGFVVLVTFALDGPEKCSGLSVARHSHETMQAALGDWFGLVEHSDELHRTPWGSEQLFAYGLFRRES